MRKIETKTDEPSCTKTETLPNTVNLLIVFFYSERVIMKLKIPRPGDK